MTTWQWQVIIALCRVVIGILEYNPDMPINPAAYYILKEAVEREK